MIPCCSPVATELEQLLVKQSSIEVYFEWLDSIAEREMHKVSYILTTPRCYGIN